MASRVSSEDISVSSRREFIKGAAVVAGTLLAGNLLAQQRAQGPRRLDLHHHFVPPRWAARALEVPRQGWGKPQYAPILNYSPTMDIEKMDQGGIETAFLSNTTPGLWFGDDFAVERHTAIALARNMNEYGARLMTDHRGRFGLFAALPLPDVDASLKELEYAFDTLKADGVGLMTSYGDIWLGDPRLQPVFEELNRRGAIVYSHPTDATCCHNLGGTGPGTLEWFTDTARTILTLLMDQPNGAPNMMSRYPNIKFVWSHAGGSLIGAASRIVGGLNEKNLANPPPNSRLAQIRRCYFDTAGQANPVVMQGLKRLLGGTSQIVFGSDLPWADGGVLIPAGLQECGFTNAELRGIDRENALTILPEYRT